MKNKGFDQRYEKNIDDDERLDLEILEAWGRINHALKKLCRSLPEK